MGLLQKKGYYSFCKQLILNILSQLNKIIAGLKWVKNTTLSQ